MKKTLLQSLLLLTIFTLQAQTPAIQWQKCYGGTGTENASCIVQTTDGGYIAAGYTNSTNGDVTGLHGSNDYWVVKIDQAGTIEWQKTYGGSFDDQASSIRQTTDGGYIVAGYSESNNGDITNTHGDKDYWILKLDAAGAIEWQHKYGGDDKEFAYDIKQTPDGGYIVVGKTYSYDGVIMPVNGDITNFHGGNDGWILKLSATGAIEWQKCLGGADLDHLMSVQLTADGGYIATGTYHILGYWLVKLSSTGAVQWEQYYGDTDDAYTVQQTSDGGYIMAGDIVSQIGNATGHNFGLIKVNSIGEVEWRKTYGGDGFFDIARCIRQTPEGGYIVTGVINSNWSGNVGPAYGQQDIWMLKLSSSGVIQWQKPMGGSSYDGAVSMEITNDGGYIVAGFAQSNNYNVSGNHGAADFWIVKLMPDMLATASATNNDVAINYYPNPATDEITFSKEVTTVTVYAINGAVVQQATVNGKQLNISQLAAGNYMLKVASAQGENYLKLVKN
jgi:hypothetical protein